MDPLDGAAPERSPDWEAFYRGYRTPGYVDGFEITSKLGGSVFGVVFRARRISIGKDYAIKFLKVDDVDVRRAVLAELAQVELFAQIDHPHLVAIEDRGEVDGIPFLVMAFAGDETLRDRLPVGRPPRSDEKAALLAAFAEAARGLQALHDRALVHFDVKPANVFLKGGVARLGDYGLSKLVTHSQGSLSVGRGTPSYMAPELLQRRGDARSDIYSLGVMLYEVLCGELPFRGDSAWEVLQQHEQQALHLPAHLTPIEREVLTRCLAKDPAARFQDVASLLDALAGRAATAASAPPLPGAPRPRGTPPPLPPQCARAAARSVAPPLPASATA
ncbi:MAG: serine/threonine-protein kinase, partial [Planctomycetota bacterium]